jgi:cytochrome c553
MTTRKLSVFLFTALLSVSAAYAQSNKSFRVKIAHEFTAAKKVLPAGTYRLSLAQVGSVLQIVGDDNREMLNLPIVNRVRGPEAVFRAGTVVFDTVENARVLAEVWMPDEGGLVLSASRTRNQNVVYSVGVAPTANLTGKAVYEQTCQKCHGPDGKGHQPADAFFGQTIPRLNSQTIQSKSDDELKTAITKGRGNMEAVRIGQPSVSHLLQPASVDAVVAHLRTLKRR